MRPADSDTDVAAGSGEDTGGEWFGSTHSCNPEDLEEKFGAAAEDPDFHALAQVLHRAERASEQGRLAEMRMGPSGELGFRDGEADAAAATARADAIAKANARIAKASSMSPRSRSSGSSTRSPVRDR